MITLAELTPSAISELKYKDLVSIAVTNGIKTLHKKKEAIQEELIALLVSHTHAFVGSKSRQDLIEKGLTEEQVNILIDGNVEKYDETFDSVINLFKIEEDVLCDVCEHIFKLEQRVSKDKRETKSDKIRAAFHAGMKLCDISKSLEAHPSFVFTVVQKERLKIKQIALNETVKQDLQLA